MALERIKLALPCKYEGLEDEASPDSTPLAVELVRRLTLNTETLLAQLRSQVVTDPSVIPAATSGEAEESAFVLATDADTDTLMKRIALG